MSAFWNGDFYFDEESSTKYGVIIVDVSSNDILKQHGQVYKMSLDKETSINFQNTYFEKEVEADTITLQFAKEDNSAWSTNDLIAIKKWLFKKNFCKFQTEDHSEGGLDIIYYLKAISSTNYFTPDMKGYIEIEFQPYDAYVYIKPRGKNIFKNGSELKIFNSSNLCKNYQPIIKITNYGDTSEEFTITNLTTKKEAFKVTGIENGKTITIDCQMATVLDEDGNNVFHSLMNYNFLELIGGYNSIKFTGNGSMEIICEYPIII